MAGGVQVKWQDLKNVYADIVGDQRVGGAQKRMGKYHGLPPMGIWGKETAFIAAAPEKSFALGALGGDGLLLATPGGPTRSGDGCNRGLRVIFVFARAIRG